MSSVIWVIHLGAPVANLGVLSTVALPPPRDVSEELVRIAFRTGEMPGERMTLNQSGASAAGVASAPRPTMGIGVLGSSTIGSGAGERVSSR